jgi:putative restriction endonuclease
MATHEGETTATSGGIRPLAVRGTHPVPNGISTLRRDLPRLFDLGCVTIRPDMRFAVSRRLRDEYANGRALQPPESDQLRPDSAPLSWHETEVFLDC